MLAEDFGDQGLALDLLRSQALLESRARFHGGRLLGVPFELFPRRHGHQLMSLLALALGRGSSAVLRLPLVELIDPDEDVTIVFRHVWLLIVVVVAASVILAEHGVLVDKLHLLLGLLP